jgi:hypothetical protein
MKKVVLGILVLIVAAIGIVIYAYLFGGCVTDQGFAKSRVVSYLEREGLPIDFLKHDAKRSSECRVAFIYHSPENEIYFSVIDNGKVTLWDVNERGPL